MPAATSNLHPPREIAADTFLTSAFDLSEPDEHWSGGFEFPKAPVLSAADAAFCHDESDHDVTAGSLGGSGVAFPRQYRLHIDCLYRPAAEWAAEMTSEAQAGLERQFSSLLAAEWWTGALAAADSNASPHLDAVAGLLVPITGALTEWEVGTTVAGDVDETPIEDFWDAVEMVAAARPGERLMFHAPIGLVGRLYERLAVVRGAGRKLVTAVGEHYVVTDPGYPRTGPGGAAATAGKAWVFVTGAVAVRRTPIEVSPVSPATMNRATNRMLVSATAWGSAVDNGVIRAAFHVTF